ncbi:MAG: hypothetical protein IKL07_06880 [Clostridium sp.]|nr:hypothetical protein [Clostridium sp.]
MKKVQVGDYGFLKRQKMFYILKVVGCIAAGILMYGVGYYVNKGNPKNICSVLALLMSLPMAKAMTEFIVVFPFQEVTKERYEKVRSICPQDGKLMTGMVITSEKRVMNLDLLLEYQGNVIALAGNKETDITYVRDYLVKGVRNWGFDYQVKVIKEEKAFLSAIQSCNPVKVSEQEQKDVVSYLQSLIVK